MNETMKQPKTPTRPTTIYELDWNESEGHVRDVRRKVVNHEPIDLHGYEPFAELTRARVGNRTIRIPLHEAVLAQPDANNILRQDIQLLAFAAFNANPRTFEPFTDMVSSNMPQEEYLRDAAIGVIPPAPSGTPAPEMETTFEGGTIIKNYLYRYIVSILGDWIKFDQIGKIQQLAQEMGLSGRMTEEYEVYKTITTAGNFTRNSTTKDNDIGANTAATTFDADGVRLAATTIATSKDRKSGAYLGYMADTFICGPYLEVPALQLFTSTALVRASANNTAEAIGTGQANPFNGMVKRIVISPWHGASFAWSMCDSTRNTLKYQTVEPFNVYQESPNMTSESWKTLDVLRYLIRGYFGVGLVDDRAWYYSSSSTDATVS